MSLSLVPGPGVGDYVLIHVGLALSVIDDEEAIRVFDILKQMGDLDELAEAP